MAKKMNARYIWIDWAKALAIIGVVMGHASTPYISFLIYAVHIPLFFAVSGFLYHPKRLDKTIISLGVPVLLFSILNAVYLFFVWHQSLTEWWSNICFFKYSFTQPTTLFTGLWFIEVLVIIRILYGDVSSKINIRNYHIPIALICLVMSCCIDAKNIAPDNLIFDFYVSRVVFCLPFFSFGIWLKDNEGSLMSINSNYVLPLLFIFVSVAFFNRGCDIFSMKFGVNYGVFYMNALIGIIIMVLLQDRFKKNLIVQYCSIGTMAILGVHSIVIDIIFSIFSFHPIIMSLTATCLSVLLGCSFTIIALRYCPALLGKTTLNV